MDSAHPTRVRRDVPPPSRSVELVRRRAEAGVGDATPVARIVTGAFAGARIVGHFIVLIPLTRKKVVRAKELALVALLRRLAHLPAVAPARKRRRGFDGQAVEREVLRRERERVLQIPVPVAPELLGE